MWLLDGRSIGKMTEGRRVKMGVVKDKTRMKCLHTRTPAPYGKPKKENRRIPPVLSVVNLLSHLLEVDFEFNKIIYAI
jgi:hypothetical protein